MGLTTVIGMAIPGAAAQASATAGPRTAVKHWGAFFGDGITHPSARVLSPTAMPLPSVPVEVASSNSTEYGLLATGSLYAWGQGTNGELGNGTTTNSFGHATQVDFPAGVHIASIPTDVMPYDTGLAIDTTGHVWGWGLNSAGQLCLGNAKMQTTPVELPLSDVTLVAGAGDHAVYYADGVLEACGGNGDGDLGDGSTARSMVPTPVKNLTGVTPVALVAAYRNSGLLASNGDVYDWGYNQNGQVGDGSMGASGVTQPYEVPLSGPAKQLVEGGSITNNGQSLVLLTDGDMYAWGDDTYGQLGDMGSVSQPAPIAVAPPTGISYVMLATGASTSYGVTATGAVFAWGLGGSGQVGNGTTENERVPQEVISSGVTQISSTANNVVTLG